MPHSGHAFVEWSSSQDCYILAHTGTHELCELERGCKWAAAFDEDGFGYITKDSGSATEVDMNDVFKYRYFCTKDGRFAIVDMTGGRVLSNRFISCRLVRVCAPLCVDFAMVHVWG